MVEFSENIKPFLSKEKCGDFSIFSECKDSFLICVADIGGHGKLNLGKCSKDIINTIKENKEENIYDLLELIKHVEKIKTSGVAIFLGRVNKSLPILQYICIGDLKLDLIREKKVINLKKQNGIIGVLPPANIEHNIFKLKDNDVIIISSDGVNRYTPELVQIVKKEIQPKKISKLLIDNYALKDDDAISCAIKYNLSGYQSIAPTSTKNKPKETIKKVYVKEIEKNKIIHENSYDFSKELTPLNEEYYFTHFKKNKFLREKTSLISKFLNFDIQTSIKIQSIILEIIEYEITDLKVYISNMYFQIQTPIDKKIVELIRPLLYNASLKLTKSNNFLIIQYNIFGINIDSIAFKNFKEMISLNLNKLTYEQYKKEKQKDDMINRQSRLATMGEMIGAIAHQWRQPLNSIGLIAQDMVSAYKYNELSEQYILEIKKDIMFQLSYMSNTIDEFRNFFKSDEENETFNVFDAIDNVIKLYHPQLNAHHLKLKILANGKKLTSSKNKKEFIITTQEGQLKQVIINCISNIKEILEDKKNLLEEQKEILINVEKSKNSIEISISDLAGGIEEKTLERIFEPYFTTKDMGTGLGLHICKTICEKSLKGKIEYKKRELIINNQKIYGSTFIISLPVSIL